MTSTKLNKDGTERKTRTKITVTQKENEVQVEQSLSPEEPPAVETVIEPTIEEEKIEEPIIEPELAMENKIFAMEPNKALEILERHKDVSIYESMKDELPMEQKITNFLNSRESGEIKMNDFLKSLFPIPKFNEPPVWLNQGASKQLRVTLENMKKNGLINIMNDTHMKLGTFYYPDVTTLQTHYHNLNTVSIVVKK